jgi:peptidylprolyl isomerase
MSAMKIPCLVFLCGCLFLAGCSKKPETTPTIPEGLTAAPKQLPPTTDKVKTTDTVIGKGPRFAEPGDTVWIVYTGTLKSGVQFDSNAGKENNPYVFTIGQGAVIKGWDQGMIGMKIGGERKLEVPASLGYGANPQAKIPANSDLIFAVKMVGLVKAGEDNVIDTVDIKKGTGDRVVKPGDTVVVEYVGSLMNGRVFEDSHQTKEPYGFRVGAEETLSCIDKGVQGMKLGGVRKIIAPPATAYAGKMNTNVPYNSEVEFVVELVSIK